MESSGSTIGKSRGRPQSRSTVMSPASLSACGNWRLRLEATSDDAQTIFWCIVLATEQLGTVTTRTLSEMHGKMPAFLRRPLNDLVEAKLIEIDGNNVQAIV